MREKLGKLRDFCIAILIGLVFDIGYFTSVEEPWIGSYIIFAVLTVLEFILLNIMAHLNRRWTESLQNSSPRKTD